MTVGQAFAIFDALSALTVFVGAVLLAVAIGEPPEFVGEAAVRGKWYPLALVMSRRKWRWGVGMVAAAFALQLPRIGLALARAFAG